MSGTKESGRDAKPKPKPKTPAKRAPQKKSNNRKAQSRRILAKSNDPLPSGLVEPIWKQQEGEADEHHAAFLVYLSTAGFRGERSLSKTSTILKEQGFNRSQKFIESISRVWFWEPRAARQAVEEAKEAYESHHRRAIASEDSIRRAVDSLLLKVTNLAHDLIICTDEKQRVEIQKKMESVIGPTPPLKFLIAAQGVQGSVGGKKQPNNETITSDIVWELEE